MLFPDDFAAQMKKLLPDFDDFVSAFQQTSPTSIRLNSAKSKICHKDSLPWSKDAYLLPQRPIFTLDPRFHAGAYYVQDASCMVLEAILKQLDLQPECILDACAAPGGKSTHLASLFPETLILANEAIQGRYHLLSENISKWGHSNLISSQLDPKTFHQIPQTFDLILADVPCSGEGLFRKDPQAIQEWSLSHVEQCAQRQRRILADLWPSLKPGGLLVYSTCTYNHQENEEQIAWLISQFGAQAIQWSLPEHWPIVQDEFMNVSTLHCYPHHAPGEGFFLAIVQKPDAPPIETPKASKQKVLSRSKQPINKIPESVQNWLFNNYIYQQDLEKIIAYPDIFSEQIKRISQLPNVSFGIELVEVKGKILKPSAYAAWSKDLKKDLFPQIHLNLEQAIQYLQGQALYDLETDATGFHLSYFEGWPLGWLNCLSSHANNLYPKSWRIRMQASTEKITSNWQLCQSIIPIQAA